jgi:5-formyltetrahydrofolate cyclo-ligase
VNPSIARNPSAQAKKTWRATLLATRLEAASDAALNAALEARLSLFVERLAACVAAPFAPRSIGFYWPLAGEFDARGWVAAWLRADASRSAALPVIAARNAPLAFHRWTPDAPMREGHHGIPEPASEERATPDLLLVPCVGFDPDGYRLGYGGGYYDRTLAAWPGAALPVTIGIAYEACRIESGVLEREAHDLPLDAIVTDSATHLTPHLTPHLAERLRLHAAPRA